MSKWDSIGKIPPLTGVGKFRRTVSEFKARVESIVKDDLPDDLKSAVPEIGQSGAKEVLAMRNKGFTGTIPELLTMSWLDKKKISYAWQYPELTAGARIDFVVNQIPPIAIRIQGEYWHRIGIGTHDRDQKYALQMLGYTVVDVWERQVYHNRENTLSRAIKGIEVPK